MTLEAALLDALRERPLSGGKLIERLQARGSELVRGRAAVVYGALANLSARGEATIVAEGPGERVWGLPGTPRTASAPPGFPPSFSLGGEELARVEREVWRRTRGLPQHYFEELRRVLVADADRRVFNGAKLHHAVEDALADLGPPAAVLRFLRRAERGGPVPLRLSRASRRWLLVPLALVGIVLLLRLLVVGVYTLPADSISMAPALVPGADGGDALVVADLVGYRLRAPRRGELGVLRFARGSESLVKRVWGLPGERLAIRKGDLFVDGGRLVKERPLLDLVRVPLLELKDLERTRAPEGWRQPKDALHRGFRLPDGSARVVPGVCVDVVVTALVRLGKPPASLTFVLDQGRPARPVLVLASRSLGGTFSVGGVEKVAGDSLRLEPGRTHEVWLTNADGLLRVEIDGREVVREPLTEGPRWAELSLVPDGEASVVSLEIARDLVFESERAEFPTLGEDEYFLMGDFGPDSRDSRQLGPVPARSIFGRAVAVAWPPSRVRWLD